MKRQVTRGDLCGYDMSVMQSPNTGANPGLFKGGGAKLTLKFQMLSITLAYIILK